MENIEKIDENNYKEVIHKLEEDLIIVLRLLDFHNKLCNKLKEYRDEYDSVSSDQERDIIQDKAEDLIKEINKYIISLSERYEFLSNFNSLARWSTINLEEGDDWRYYDMSFEKPLKQIKRQEWKKWKVIMTGTYSSEIKKHLADNINIEDYLKFRDRRIREDISKLKKDNIEIIRALYHSPIVDNVLFACDSDFITPNETEEAYIRIKKEIDSGLAKVSDMKLKKIRKKAQYSSRKNFLRINRETDILQEMLYADGYLPPNEIDDFMKSSVYGKKKNENSGTER